MARSGMVFHQITIIGLGLIGSSIARAARKYKLAEFIVGCDTQETALTYARSQGYVDTALRDPALAAQGSQMIILATPPSSFAGIVKKIAPKLREGAILMDTASVKQPAMNAIAAVLPLNVNFVPAHPIAGSEQFGGSAGSETLFQRQRIIVTPNEPLHEDVLRAVTSFWTNMGARVEGMPAPLHDLIYAYMSHLPHLLAYGARDVIGAHATLENGTLDRFLRLSHSRALLWNEIFFLNRENMQSALDSYLAALIHIARELASPDASAQSENLDDTLARTVLFPRIAASCLITAVIEAEKIAGISFARYAGHGFADFTLPANAPPDHDIENISEHNAAVAGVLAEYIERLSAWREMLVENRFSELQQALAHEKRAS